ncbi:MAG: adenylyl-sulfate kinase [Bacteroidota bacterium]
MEKNIVKHQYKIGVSERRKAYGHDSFLVFFTGLSGSGKSTIANALEEKLFSEGIATYVLDGDNVRSGINKDLSFSAEDRSENNRRIGEVAKLFVDAGLVVLAAFVAPFQRDRAFIRDTVGVNNYVEVFVNVPLEECERRDVKGLYKKARAGEIKDMTGISSPYEAPTQADVEVTHLNSIEESVTKIYTTIKEKLSRES